ncbi:MAG: signal peptide peptidase SppA, partial [Gammaproteobacteria bacterium]
TLRLQEKSTLVLRPYGDVVDEYSTTPLDRAIQRAAGQPPPETRLRDLLGAFGRATNDPRITQMLIDTDQLQGIGLSSLQDLERAVARFKEAGKPVVAMGLSMGQAQYYLASMADEVWLRPDGMVWIDGYANVRNYFREALEKLEVEVNLFRVGEFKSAMEPFIRDDMSEEAKEAARYWLGSLWQQYLEGVTRNRGIPLQTLVSALDEMPERVEAAGGDFAQFALQVGLVDRLVHEPEARQELALRGAPGRDDDGFRAVEFDAYLDATAPVLVDGGRPDIVVLAAEGEIIGGMDGPGVIGAERIAQSLRKLARQDHVRAVVLRVNSPGGDAAAAEQIRRELQALKEAGKTLVVSMGNVAASGGYWIAMGADEVWASPSTITGSIGVFGFLPTFGGTLEKIGVHTDGVGTTDLAGKLRVDRPLDPKLRRLFQASVEDVYADFLQLVSQSRGLSVEEVDEVARGRVWSGAQAADRGLVDRLGTLQDAVDAAARIAGLGSDYSVDWFEPALTPFEQFMMDMTTEAVVRVPALGASLTLPGAAALPPLAQLPFARGLVDDLGALLRSDGRLTVAAHCLCRLP